jgi:hypothetical protein
MDMVRADAANLVELNPNVIVIVGDRVIPILTKLTRSIPMTGARLAMSTKFCVGPSRVTSRSNSPLNSISSST